MNTPENITSLKPNEIFVFGSNLAGRHGKGAAKQALKFGAIRGEGVGPAGQTYGIPTKCWNLGTLDTSTIRRYVGDFLDYAKSHQELTFLVTPIGCGLAGYSPKDIAPMFAGAPSNVILPTCFTSNLDR